MPAPDQSPNIATPLFMREAPIHGPRAKTGAHLDCAADIPERGGKRTPEIDEETVRSLHAKIGELAVERIAERALQGATGETAIGFDVSDGWFDGAVPAQVAPERRRHPTFLAGEIDRRGLDTVAPVAAIHEGPLRPGVSQD